MTHPSFLAALLLSIAFAVPGVAQEGSVSVTLTPGEFTWHVLNRLAFGPLPGQVDDVNKQGWMNWVLAQMEPEKIDDTAVESLIRRRYPSMRMTIPQIYARYHVKPRGPRATPSELYRREVLKAKIGRELTDSVLMRAVLSKRQLAEVMVNFWRNHFNVDHQKESVQYLANNYEEQVIRKHVFGKFGDMLMASAKHPAMLVYLDNHVSQKKMSAGELAAVLKYLAKLRKAGDPRVKYVQIRGLNENYSRELFELHTLGVDKVYKQKDVEEAARLLTGWSVNLGDKPKTDHYGFQYRRVWHDKRPKKVLGLRFSGREGVGGGEKLIRHLAGHAATAKLISYKLCRYLVNDRPPGELVEKVAKVFRDSGGDLKKVYTAIIFSPEFRGRASYRAKFKTPFEFVCSAIRATGSTITDPTTTEALLTRMGQPTYKMDDPTGYHDQAEAWLDPGVLVYRWHFALNLAASRLSGVSMPQSYYARFDDLGREELMEKMIGALLPSGIDARSKKILKETAARTPGKDRLAVHLLGMLLGCPTYQQQ